MQGIVEGMDTTYNLKSLNGYCVVKTIKACTRFKFKTVSQRKTNSFCSPKKRKTWSLSHKTNSR